jgi:hypothetical protein
MALNGHPRSWLSKLPLVPQSFAHFSVAVLIGVR